MVQKVTLSYSSPGLRPPVYVTTSLSEPQWEILEMEMREGADGQYHFEKVFHARPGEYQYKFRLGPGDWWVCDEGKEVVDDGMGNRNNLVFVKEVKSAPMPVVEEPKSASIPAVEEPKVTKESEQSKVVGESSHVEDKDEHKVPLFAHESHPTGEKLEAPHEDVPVNMSSPRQDTLSLSGHGDYSNDEGDVEPSHHESSPLFRHETGFEPLQTTHDDRTPGAYEGDEDEYSPPLLTHESLAPTPREQDLAPLFQHESGQIGKHMASHADHDEEAIGSPLSHTSNQIPPEADIHDPDLENFPTSHQGIMGSIRRASLRLAEDETTDESIASPSSPSSLAKSVSHTRSASPSLPSVQENEEEETARDHSHVEQPQPKGIVAASADKAKNFAQGLQTLAESVDRPAALITPPRTPDVEAHESKAMTEPAPEPKPMHASEHHHPPQAERDMADEAAHDVSHHDGRQAPSSSTPTPEADKTEEEEKPTDAPSLVAKPKSLAGSSMEAMLGMGVTLAIGVLAVWVALKVGMGDAAKDGGATLHG